MIIALKYFFKAYITDDTIRKIINEKNLLNYAVNPVFSLEAFRRSSKMEKHYS